MDRVANVNIFQGTASDRRLSTGNTYPAIARPWGMTYWSPQTDGGPWMYQPPLSSRGVYLHGVRATHQASPWMGDYGHFLLQPIAGPVKGDAADRGSLCRMSEMSADPSVLRCELRAWGIAMELTATERAAVMRLRFGDTSREAGLAVGLFGKTCEARLDDASSQIVGCARLVVREDRGQGMPGFGCWFVIEADTPMRQEGRGDTRDAIVRFPKAAGRTVTLRIGTSFISVDQARENLRREVGGRSLDDVAAQSRQVWNDELGRITVEGGSTEVHRTFDSGLYRVLLFPRTLHEIDAAGRTVHWSPYDCRVHEGTMVTDHGFWDTYRTVYPLLALAWPRKYGQLVEAWVRCYEQSGWLPRWASPGHRACMVGNHLAAVIADAAVKDIGGFDLALAYEGMRKDATEPGDPRGLFGRQELHDYLELGYLPDDRDIDSVARTLDYAYNDWCCAVVAGKLGRHEDAAMFKARGGNWRHVFDAGTGFLRGRNADGSWATPFDPLDWGRAYVEGSAYQFRFAVPHDLPGLVEAFGGREAFLAAWDQMLTTPPRFGVGRYGAQVHEMAEMASVDVGQYAQSNQPVHAFAWLPAMLGDRNRTAELVHRVCDELYSPDLFPGDEDNGEMAAWYVLARLGHYSPCPGDPRYALTRPSFDRVTLRTDDDRTLQWTGKQWQALLDETTVATLPELAARFS